MTARNLTDFIRVYDEDLPADFCRRMVDGFESSQSQLQANGRGVVAGLDHSSWVELDVGRMADKAFLGFFMHRLEMGLERYNRDTRLGIPVPLRPRTDRLIMKRYRPGGHERFEPHFDSVDSVAQRYMVFLWYLNDVEEGGETTFTDLDFSVRPKTGRLLMFPPYWMYQHAALPPISGSKYIISTYLMF